MLSKKHINNLRSLIKLDECIEGYTPKLPEHPNTVYISVVDKEKKFRFFDKFYISFFWKWNSRSKFRSFISK